MASPSQSLVDQSTSSNQISAPKEVLDLLKQLHDSSLAQEDPLKVPGGFYQQYRSTASADPAAGKAMIDDEMRDKFIALAEDKASFVYNILRSNGALNVIEAGTSFGVSTIYLALAVGQNAINEGKTPGQAKVVATEFEPTKAARAREHWKRAGESVEKWIELREGDILETLKKDLPSVVDMVLFDIWSPLVLPTLKTLEPHFRPGTVLIADNVISSRQGYAEFFTHIRNGPYTSMTLPFQDGLGMYVYSTSANT